MNIEKAVKKHLGHLPTILGSKGRLHFNNRNNLYVFNAQVCIPGQGKVWKGDLNLSDKKTIKSLEELRQQLRCFVEVYHESGGLQVLIVGPENTTLGEGHKEYYEFKDGAFTTTKEHRRESGLDVDSLVKAGHSIDVEPKDVIHDLDVYELYLITMGKDAPLIEFYKHIADKLKHKDMSQIDVGKVYLNAKTMEKLNKICFEHLLKECHGDEYSAVKSYNYMMVDVGPMMSNSECVRDDRVYITGTREVENNEKKAK